MCCSIFELVPVLFFLICVYIIIFILGLAKSRCRFCCCLNGKYECCCGIIGIAFVVMVVLV